MRQRVGLHPDRLRSDWLTIFGAVLAAATVFQTGFALITGGEGNEPIRDPGWPAGAAAIFNHPGRVAYWEGPPFGGGQWHAECRGDAAAFNQVLADFARLDVKTKRVVVHDGIGRSFWLNPNGEAEKAEAAKIDWIFMVWQPASWDRLRQLPVGLNPTKLGHGDDGPPAQIDVYAGGNIRWEDVKLPPGLEIVDERLEAHGYSLADGTVLEGNITDLATKQPIAAHVELQLVESQARGGNRNTTKHSVAADDRGHWVLKNAPTGRYRIVVVADGYVPRVTGYAQFDDQPSWRSYDCGLARPAQVSGRVVDGDGAPLQEVRVQLGDVAAQGDTPYDSPQDYETKTDVDGQFRFERVPVGTATIWVHKPGYCRPGLGPAIKTPKEAIELSMTQAGRVQVAVDFTATTRPEAYLVEIEPEGGSKIGSWGGSAHIDANNQYSFTDVPPGRYVLKGRPNPGSELRQTEPVTVDVKGGTTATATLQAK